MDTGSVDATASTALCRQLRGELPDPPTRNPTGRDSATALPPMEQHCFASPSRPKVTGLAPACATWPITRSTEPHPH